MRSIRATHNLIAVSAYQKETAINTAQTLDLTIMANASDVITADRRREANSDDLTGMEEADLVYDLGQMSSLGLNFDKAQPQHFALLYGYALGNIASAAAGSTGYKKTITPMDGDLDWYRSLPSFTAAQRFGKTVAQQRWYSMFMDSVTATFARDSWVKITGQAKGTGKMDASITEESVTDSEDSTALTLAANGVAGTTAAERLDAVHQVRAETSAGVWEDVTVTAVSDAVPAVLTIAAPGAGAGDITYKILYAPVAEAWQTFPAAVTETPMRVSEMQFCIGGKWNGSAFEGGKCLGAGVNSVEHSLSNNGAVEFIPSAGGAYGGVYFREGREQTLKLDREFRDYMLQNWMDQNEYFGARIVCTGAEYESGQNYKVELVFPRLGLLSAPISVNGKRLGEAGDMRVLQDDTYGSVIVYVTNKQQYYAA